MCGGPSRRKLWRQTLAQKSLLLSGAALRVFLSDEATHHYDHLKIFFFFTLSENSIYLLKVSVSVSCAAVTKDHRQWGLNNRYLSSHSSGGRSLGSRCGQGCARSGGSRGGSFSSWGLQGPLARGHITPVSVCVFTRPLPLSVRVSPSLLLKDTRWI